MPAAHSLTPVSAALPEAEANVPLPTGANSHGVAGLLAALSFCFMRLGYAHGVTGHLAFIDNNGICDGEGPTSRDEVELRFPALVDVGLTHLDTTCVDMLLPF